MESNLDMLTSICREAVNDFTGDFKDDFPEYLAICLSEQNVTVLPFKLGDKLYRACSWFDKVDELTVSMITQKKDGSFKIRMTSSIHKSVQDFSLDNIADPKYDIYTDKTEAEAAHQRAREARFKALLEQVKKRAD